MFDFLDKTGIKFLLEFVKSKLSGKSDSGHTHSKADITDFPASLPANGGNADYATNAGNADTVNGLHANDFVNATDRSQIQIPSNVDVPAWIYANGKRYQLYMTNSGNAGTTNIPNDSTDYVWYWFDGVNIIAREWATGRYYICDLINGGFSGWKDIYTSGYKPYVTGVASARYGEKADVSFGFTPSIVLYRPVSPKNDIPDSIYQATNGVDANGFIPNTSTYNQASLNGFFYIAFK